eukprot:m.21891 g.21891  ORF g.21891 m.21891 type:complete len:77 (-) comp9197_c0_seq2:81-311(-)
MDTAAIKRLFDSAAQLEAQANFAEASRLYLECSQLVLQLLRTGAVKGKRAGTTIPLNNPCQPKSHSWLIHRSSYSS